MPASKRVRLACTVQPEMAEWVLSQIGPNKPYYKVSHCLETAVDNLRNNHKLLSQIAALRAALHDTEGQLKEAHRHINSLTLTARRP